MTMQWRNRGHELDAVGNALNGKKIVYLYGLGGVVRHILRVFDGMKKFIPWEIRLVDRDVKKQEMGLAGRKVLSPEEFYAERHNDSFVVAAPAGNVGREIASSVISHGVPQQDVYGGEYFLFTYLPIYFLYQHDIVFFTSESFLPSTFCNLNCRDCLNFTPYIKKHVTYSIEQIKESIDVFFQAVDYIYVFQITGGEPLLYKDLPALIQYIDGKYGKRILKLEMVANGTVLPDDTTCKILKDCHVTVILDDYRMSLSEHLSKKHDEVVARLDQHHVEWQDNYVEQWIRLYTPECFPQEKTLSELQHLYEICGNPWSTLENGKISSCNYALYANNAGVVENDASEVYDLHGFTPDKKRELIEFRVRYNEKGYVNLCKKCNGWTTINQMFSQAAIQIPRDK